MRAWMIDNKKQKRMSRKSQAFGRRLQALRKARDWTQVELAQRLQYATASIVAVEGGRKPGSTLVEKVADLFAVDATELHALAGTAPHQPLDPTTFGGFLTQQRARQQLTQQQVASAVGITDSYLSKLEQGTQPLTKGELVQRLALILQCDIDMFFVRAGLLDVPSPAEQAQPEGPPPRLADLAQQNPAFGLALREMRHFTDDQRQTVIELVERLLKEQE